MAQPPRSPLAPAAFPRLPPLAGVRAAVARTGIRGSAKSDLTLVELAPGTAAAGVFTTSRTAAAPVVWSRRVLGRGRARALVVNAGNANAFTGRAGDIATRATAEAAARELGCPAAEVFIASTGIIGVALPSQKILAKLPRLHRSARAGGWKRIAEAIRTTDTYPKGAGADAEIAGERVRINGIAKGSGMIAPDMATMLAFVFTDAAIAAPALQGLLRRINRRTFNAITVDGDTSTNDTVLLFATGRRGGGTRRGAPIVSASDPRLGGFAAALERVMRDLAHQIVRDGEGATKFVTVTVTGAAGAKAAHRIAMTIANSPLVKTAIAGADANWGRIVAAVGRAGERVDPAALTIAIGGVPVTSGEAPLVVRDSAALHSHMQGADIAIDVDVGIGAGRATVWTCDLTHGYITINAEYHT